MKSPFPGMDPYLEAHWGDVHSRLAIYASDYLNPALPPGLRARVEETIAVENDDWNDEEVANYYPDVQILDAGGNGSLEHTSAAGSSATIPIIVARNPEPETYRSVHIVTAAGNKLVTAIEFLSPSNKVGKRGRDTYRVKQEEILSSGASIVEVDLIRAGQNALAVRVKDVPRRFRNGYLYRAFVVRGWDRQRAELYPISLRDKLPKIKIPLRRKDPDVLLDLQALLDEAYSRGRYDSIDYREELRPKLPAEDATWANKLLKKAGLR